MTARIGSVKTCAQNRKARHLYTIESTLEAGLVLLSSEVKSIRMGRAALDQAYAHEMGGELFLVGMHVSPYQQASWCNHDPARARKLLVHRRERAKLFSKIKTKGVTLVPLHLYVSPKGKIKVEIAVAVGKNQADRRETIKERDWNRQKAQLLRSDR